MKRFLNNARVCFIGDSITHNNLFVAHIAAYYREHFPAAGVEFYNCGISGGSLTTVLNVFDEDIRPYAPTHAVLMIGINDSKRNALNDSGKVKYEALKEAYDQYNINLDIFCRKLKETDTELILCTPMPYDEYSKTEVPSLPGASALMLGYAEFIKKYASEYGYPVCDYHSYITRIMQEEVVFNPDHVHPNSRGHYYMAKCFLAFQGCDLGGERELPADIQDWHRVVELVRNTIATEHFILKDDFTTTQEERREAIRDYLENEQSGPYVTYFEELAAQYQDIKPKQQENIRFVIDFMKNQSSGGSR